jgi:hypothetical protein
MRRRAFKPEPPRPSVGEVITDKLGRRFVVTGACVTSVYARQLGSDGALFDAQCLLDLEALRYTGEKFSGVPA